MFVKSCQKCQSSKFLRKKQSLNIFNSNFSGISSCLTKGTFCSAQTPLSSCPTFAQLNQLNCPRQSKQSGKIRMTCRGDDSEGWQFFFFCFNVVESTLGTKVGQRFFFLGQLFVFFHQSNMKAQGCNSFLSSCSLVVDVEFFCEEDGILNCIRACFLCELCIQFAKSRVFLILDFKFSLGYHIFFNHVVGV